MFSFLLRCILRSPIDSSCADNVLRRTLQYCRFSGFTGGDSYAAWKRNLFSACPGRLSKLWSWTRWRVRTHTLRFASDGLVDHWVLLDGCKAFDLLDEFHQWNQLATRPHDSESSQPVLDLISSDTVLLHVEIDFQFVPHLLRVVHEVFVNIFLWQHFGPPQFLLQRQFSWHSNWIKLLINHYKHSERLFWDHPNRLSLKFSKLT